MKFIKLIIFFATIGCWAQKYKTVPIFPGCENLKKNSELSTCMNQKLNTALGYELLFFSIVADYLELPKADSKVDFNINKEGLISDVVINGENEIFNGFVFSTFYLINSKINRANLHIIPAKNQKDETVEVNYKIPMKFVLDPDKADYPSFNKRNRLLFTFDNPQDKEKIEIRIDTAYTLSTYAIRNNREFFLGNYKSLVDLAIVEPYASNIEDNFKSGKTLVTKGNLNDKEYTVQIKNFFSNDPNVEYSIEVFNEVDNEWKEYYQYKSKEEFNQSPFAVLTYRK